MNTKIDIVNKKLKEMFVKEFNANIIFFFFLLFSFYIVQHFY